MKARALLLLSTLCLLASVSLAHQPYDSGAVVRLDPEGLELTFTASADVATKLLGYQVTTEEDFTAVRAKAVSLAGSFYELHSGQQLLPLQRAEASFQAGELTCTLLYPPCTSDQLSVKASYLERLSTDYGSSLTLVKVDGSVLQHAPPLRRIQGKESFRYVLPETSHQSALKQRATALQSQLQDVSWQGAFLAVLSLLLVAWFLFFMKQRNRKSLALQGSFSLLP